jgi:Fibronectin type III domain
MNRNLKNSPFLGTPAPRARCRNPHAPSWSKFLGGIASLLILSLSLGRAAQSVTLAWDANSEPNIAGYKLHYGTAKGKPSQSVNVDKTKTTATVSNLNDGTTYFFTVTAYNIYKNTLLESQPSNEVSYKTAPLGAHALTVNSGSGSGKYTESTRVKVSAKAPAAGQKFDRWTGDWQILDNPFDSTTTALMLFRDLTIEATYRVVDKIRFYPRLNWTARMVGGVFEGTNGNPVTGTYTNIYTIRTNPPPAWSEVIVDLGNFRYLRYRGPNGSYGNVAEIEFYRKGVKANGVGYGTPGSWNNNGNSFGRALDGNVNTRFDGPTANGAYVGIDTAAPTSALLAGH